MGVNGSWHVQPWQTLPHRIAEGFLFGRVSSSGSFRCSPPIIVIIIVVVAIVVAAASGGCGCST
jgi:hypothetical protein